MLRVQLVAPDQLGASAAWLGNGSRAIDGWRARAERVTGIGRPSGEATSRGAVQGTKAIAGGDQAPHQALGQPQRGG